VQGDVQRHRARIRGSGRGTHFKDAQQSLPPHLAETPRIINFTVPQDDWSELGELAVRR
jgi:hypothetical protein